MSLAANYINGHPCAGTGSTALELVSSIDGAPMGQVQAGAAADIDQAVQAASLAFTTWSEQPTSVRTGFLRAIADGIEARTDEFAELAAKEVGTTIGIAKAVQVGLALDVLRSTADAMDALVLEERSENFLAVKEPIGVVGAITPWNFPLHQVVAKLAPALATGCTIVVKPAELTTLSSIALFEVIHQAGLPAGVANLVCGVGAEVGEALASHPMVDMVSFTGSTAAGVRVSTLAAKDVKKVALELGGKSASVILADADLGRAVSSTLGGCYLNSGQVCSALTRLIVLKSQLQEIEALLETAVAKFAIGDPLDPGTRVGPVASAVQQDRVLHYIEAGIAEGARLLAGSAVAPDRDGFYVTPTIFTDVKSKMKVAQEEIFGPVLVVIPVEDEEEALRVANDSDYGLSGAVWTADEAKGVAFARKMRTGQVQINNGAFNAHAPFGGYKKSGIGRELGKYGLEEYLEYKAIRF
ncbi:MAG: aldehyde dehydrogenase family protein [Candidatus Nanopelagicales bacterium]|nr:aldehyde dehydrogenase family protein [Candidatus Nanopelagicales bacterium]